MIRITVDLKANARLIDLLGNGGLPDDLAALRALLRQAEAAPPGADGAYRRVNEADDAIRVERLSGGEPPF